tara:strand:- start:200 stop:373 length:174 start_codon:yes stop_codon:yes gene_type:complete
MEASVEKTINRQRQIGTFMSKPRVVVGLETGDRCDRPAKRGNWAEKGSEYPREDSNL